MTSVVVLNSDSDWDAVYVDGDLVEQGSFNILYELEDILPGKFIEGFEVWWLNAEGEIWLENYLEFPDSLAEVPEACIS